MADLKFTADIDDKKLTAKVNKIDSELQSLAVHAARSGNLLDSSFTGASRSASDLERQTINVGNAMKYVGSIVSLSLLGGLAKEISSVRGEWQVYEAVLTNTLGSQTEAAESLDMIAKYGARTNFQVNELTDSYVKLVNQGFKPTRQELESLGDLAASKGKGFAQLAEAIIDAETLEFERLKEFGIRASKDGEQVTFTFKGIKTTVDATAESIRNYVLSLGELKGVQGSTEAISKTITGLASNFKDAVDQMLNSIGKTNEGLIADAIKTGTELVQNYEQVIDVVKVLIATYGTYKAASIVTVVLKEVEAAGSLASALRQTAIAQTILNTAQKANPAGLALAGITALIGGYTLWQSQMRKTKTFSSELNSEIADEVLKLDSLFKSLKTTGEGTKQRADAIKLVNDRYSDYLTNLLTEKTTLEDIETAQKNVTNALIANITVQKSKDKLSDVLGDVSAKFDKEFGDFIQKFGEVYGTDRIPEFVTSINSAIDEKISQGGGQVKRGILEYSDIAKDVYDQFLVEIGRKTGFLKYDFKDFQESFLDFAEFKAEKSGFIGQLEGMIAAYQQMLDKFKKEAPGGGSGGGNAEQDSIKKQISDLYETLQTADEKDRKIIAARIVTLQQELLLRQQIADYAVKSVRNDAVPGTISPKNKNIFSGDVSAIKDADLEYGKLNKKVDESIKKANKLSKELSNEQAAKAWENQKYIIDQTIQSLDIITQQYAEQLGLSEEQAKVLGGGMEAMSGIVDIATGNYIQGAAKLIEASIKLFVKSPEEFSERWKGVNEQISITIKSLDLAEKSLSNIGSSSTLVQISKVKQELRDLSDEAAELTKALSGTSYGPRRNDTSTIIIAETLRQRVELEKSIEELSLKLISGNLSTKQREAIEAVIDSYNQLIDKIDAITKSVTGTTANELSTALSDAIIEGADAWDVWKSKAVDVIKYVTSQQLSAKLINAPITEAINALVNDSADGLTAEEAIKFQDQIKAIYEAAEPLYQTVIDSMRNAGIDLVGNSTPKGVTGAIQGITEETGGIISGQMNAIRVDIKTNQDIARNQLEILDQGLSELSQIKDNTKATAVNTSKLNQMSDDIKETNRILREKL